MFVWEFLLERPKFKENVIICVITVIKVRDLLLTLLQVMTTLAPKMNEHRFFILIHRFTESHIHRFFILVL